jgi:hypothetical protein
MHNLMIYGLSLIWHSNLKEIKMFRNAARRETNYMQNFQDKSLSKDSTCQTAS